MESKQAKRRQVIIETDGRSIFIIKREVTDLELAYIFRRLLAQIEN